jgi:predicted secreted hydrolase
MTVNRPLKSVGEAGKTRQKQARKRSLRAVNEHSEPVFNAVLPTQVVFQRPAKHLLSSLLLSLALLAGCDQAPEPRQGFAGLGEAAQGFARVERGQPLVFPRDHGAHPGYRIEWWYVTANLTDEQGRDWGVQWTLFRSALRPGEEQPGWQSPNLWMGHAGLSGPFGHLHSERLARGGIGQAGVEAEPFHAWIDDWSLRGEPGQGLQQLQMQAAGEDFRYRLQLRAKGPLVLHGERGYSEKSGAGQASYYYSQPFYRVSGEIERDGQRFTVSGQAWLDREWSSQPLAAEQQGWDWFSLHLASGAKLMLFQVRQADGEPYRAGTWIDADGRAQALRGEQIQLSEQTWTRQAHGRKMPTRWRIQVAEHGVDVQAEAIQPQAWMDTSFPYWEGPVRLIGEPGGRGYLEMTGY